MTTGDGWAISRDTTRARPTVPGRSPGGSSLAAINGQLSGSASRASSAADAILRVRLSGVLTGSALSHAYATADLLVAPSRSETYGMTVTEALAHGLPVIAAAVGGLPEALGSTADGTRPGQLIPPGDPAALATALADWLGDERHRHRLRAAAQQRRSTLRGWEQTTREIANALTAHGRSMPVPPVVKEKSAP